MSETPPAMFSGLDVTPTPARSLRVPNELPSLSTPSRVGFLGDCPGDSEIEAGIPFVGASGQLLNQLMQQAGLIRSACFIGHVCQYQPEKNNIKAFNPYGEEFKESKAHLAKDMLTHKPNVMVLLGDTAFAFAGFQGKKVSDWRGSILQCTEVGNPLFGMKVIPTFHPSQLLKMWDWSPLAMFDLLRAAQEGMNPLIVLPERNIKIAYSIADIVMLCRAYREAKLPVALDIEGYVNNVTSISFSNKVNESFVVPLLDLSPTDECIALRAITELLTDLAVPKILQNGLYDATVLAQTYGILIRNFIHDTLLGGWEIYPELPKGLGVQTSIWTREPFYKFEKKTDDRPTHYRYNAKDSMVTLEISQKQVEAMDPVARGHYDFNVRLLRPLLYTQLRGIKYDVERSKLLHAQTKVRLEEVTQRLRQHAGNPKFNPGSHIQVKKLLYDQFRFPKQFNKKEREKLASDVPALLNLLQSYQHPVIIDLLLVSKLDKEREYLEMQYGTDGRMHCSYNVVGTDTGRLSCSKSADGKGGNLQTVPKKFRHLYLADDGMEFFQCDLEGADGWTVAAECISYGDKTMMDDYLFGMKPAKIVALMFLADAFHANATDAIKQYPIIAQLQPTFLANPKSINGWSREQLKAASKFINEEGPAGWLYFTCKRAQHATNYGTGTSTMKQQVLQDSYKVLGNPIVVPLSTCKTLQDLYHLRYPGVKFWQDGTQYRLKNSRGFPQLADSSGHIRRFFGRKTDHETFRSMLSHKPQANTSYVTNLAIESLWSDRSNRNGSRLIIEPLHQVHDAVCGQWPIDKRDWAMKRVAHYFDHPITINESTLIIPYDGGYGRSWGEAKTPMSF